MSSNKITIDIQKIQEKYDYLESEASRLYALAEKHSEEAKKIKSLLESLDAVKELSESVSTLPIKTTVLSSPKKQPVVPAGESRMAKALEICEEMLRRGEVVSTAKQFHKRISKKGIILSRQGVAAVLSKAKNINYDRKRKLYVLVK